MKPFREYTKSNEGMLDLINRILPCIEFLLQHLENTKEIYRHNIYMTPRVDAAWAKLEKYYKHTDDTIIYVAATILNPVCKWTYFERRWTTAVLRNYLISTQAKLK